MYWTKSHLCLICINICNEMTVKQTAASYFVADKEAATYLWPIHMDCAVLLERRKEKKKLVSDIDMYTKSGSNLQKYT